VTRLEYQAYTKLALNTMTEIVTRVREVWDEQGKPLVKCVIHHRLGTVPVGNPSIGNDITMFHD
jgi:molybdopterin synthase catalytic subunit